MIAKGQGCEAAGVCPRLPVKSYELMGRGGCWSRLGLSGNVEMLLEVLKLNMVQITVLLAVRYWLKVAPLQPLPFLLNSSHFLVSLCPAA